jgi:hypothetical protein
MRRNNAPGGDRRVVSIRVVPVLLAGCIGYLLGSAHIEAFRVTDISAADSVALRFPQDWKGASLTAVTALRTTAIKFHPQKPANVADASAAAQPSAVAPQEQLALLDPAPTVPQSNLEATADTTLQARVQTASADNTDPSVATALSAQQPAPTVPQKPVQSSAIALSPSGPAAKVAAAPPRHPPANERPGYILNDAQIASIKVRLHLTPDQEEMWPAVEAALRNMAYTHLPPGRGRGAAAGETQTAAVDPNAVQGLKSAAVPLILSFNSEQKEEVRNLVHVMGLDQLASQF